MENRAQTPSSLPRIQVLRETVAQRIAAGEVIDRPYAAVRELLDNAIDSEASDITVHLHGGGVDEIRIIDNGCGIHKDDLSLCWLPHATSKISTLDDLDKVYTLGFRGEALSSLASCSRLEIISSSQGEAHKVEIHGGKLLENEPYKGAPGTTVSVRNLFFNMPARRKFIKSVRAENTLCRRIFLEKAVANPDLNFRLFIDGQLKTYLPASSFRDRVERAWPRLGSSQSWWESTGVDHDFSITVVHARPEISRKDRQYIQIYANRRRIDEFALVQGVVHAYDNWMPGGTFPIAFVFIDIDPKLVDFNIHPAKKEARFRDLPTLRHRMIEIIRQKLTDQSYKNRAHLSETQEPLIQKDLEGMEYKEKSYSSTTAFKKPAYSNPQMPPQKNHVEKFVNVTRELRSSQTANSNRERFAPSPLPRDTKFHYLGQTMGLFLLAEAAGSLFIVDQHAAHERILFERFCDASPASQKLLFPHKLNMDEQALIRLEIRRERLEKMGFVFSCSNEKEWELTSIPQVAETYENEIANIIEIGIGEPESLEKDLWANLACKAAVKDTDPLDDDAAKKLLSETFNLKTPRCPHGRPIWFEISRNELFELVGRKV